MFHKVFSLAFKAHSLGFALYFSFLRFTLCDFSRQQFTFYIVFALFLLLLLLLLLFFSTNFFPSLASLLLIATATAVVAAVVAVAIDIVVVVAASVGATECNMILSTW